MSRLSTTQQYEFTEMIIDYLVDNEALSDTETTKEKVSELVDEMLDKVELL